MRVVDAVCAVAIIFGAGCNNADFKSADPKKSQETRVKKPAQHALSIPCKDGVSELKTTVSGSRKNELKIEGEFCGIPEATAEGHLTALFILDYSGSMQNNDPETAGTCGRLKAGVAIADKLKAAVTDSVSVQVGYLQFADDAIPGASPVDLELFGEHLTAEKFCGNTSGSTNYEAALLSARDMLKTVEGPKVIYFISDGLPTKASSPQLDPVSILGSFNQEEIFKAGTRAAETLRTEVNDLTLFAVYLGNSNLTDLEVPTGFDPETYLSTITGKRENVKLVTGADQLASEIVKFETPEVIVIDQDTIKAVLRSEDGSESPIEIANLEKNDLKSGSWIFETESFELDLDEDDSSARTVEVTVKGSDGKEYRAVAHIDFSVK